MPYMQNSHLVDIPRIYKIETLYATHTQSIKNQPIHRYKRVFSFITHKLSQFYYRTTITEVCHHTQCSGMCKQTSD